MTLGLPDANDPDISPHDHRHSADGPNSSTSNQHHHLRVPVGTLNRNTSRRAHRVRQLHRDVLVDDGQLGELGGRKAFGELLREDSLPDGGGDGQADGATDVTENAQHGQDHGNVLMGSGGHDGDLVADDDGAGGERYQDLAHDDVADVTVGPAEGDHQPHTQDAQRNTEEEADGLIASGKAYQQAHGESGQDGAHGVSLNDVAGTGHAQVIHYLQEGAEVAVPAVVTEKQRSGKDASAEDGTIQEERIWNECDGSEEPLPYSKGDHKCDARDQQADDKGGAPPVRLQSVKIEWQEKESDAREQNETDSIELAAVVQQGPPRRTLTLVLRDEALLRGLGVIIHQKAEERKGYGGYDDGESPKAPTPARSLQVGRGDWPC